MARLSLAARIRQVRMAHEADEAQEETDKQAAAARIAELEKQLAEGAGSPEIELEIARLEEELGLSADVPDQPSQPE